MTAAITTRFPVSPLRFRFTEIDERAGARASELPLLSVSVERGVVPRVLDDGGQAPSEDVSHYKVCSTNDLAINKLRAFQGGLGVAAQTGMISPAYAVLRFDDRSHPRYVHYLMRSHWFVGQMTARLRGVGGVDVHNARTPHINVGDIGLIHAPEPPLDTQRRIADMLDAETARIDTLIEKNERVLELLKRRFWSWVEHVTHHGLTVGTSMDGHPVWGKHPSHWSATTLGRAAVSMVDGPFGSSLTSAHYSDAGRRVVRLGNVGRGRFKDEVRAYIPEDHYGTLASHEVRGGDLVMGGLGDDASDAPVGRACVVPEHFGSGIVKADCYRIRLANHVDHAYAAWALSSGSQLAYAASKARGATRARLNLQLASELPLPVPPLEVQKAIASEVGNRLSQTHALSAKVDRQQELLRLRRQALITAAVTGEIEV